MSLAASAPATDPRVAPQPRRRRDGWIPLLLILLGLVPSVAGIARLAELSGGPEITPANARFVASPLPVVIHVLSVVPYCLLGAFQFAPAFRRRHRDWHRATGRVLVVLGMSAALSGLWMTFFYPWPAGDGVEVYGMRIVFGAGMAACLVLAVLAIPRRDFAAHGRWMTRAYAIGLGAGTQVLTHLPWFLFVGKPFEETPRAVMMGAGWVLNVIVAEWILWRRREGRTAGAGGRALAGVRGDRALDLL